MKPTGIVRKVDNLGRIVLPAEMRRIFELNTDADVEFYTDNKAIIMKKYSPECMVCGETKDYMINISGQKLCYDCIDNLYHKIHREMEL